MDNAVSLETKCGITAAMFLMSHGPEGENFIHLLKTGQGQFRTQIIMVSAISQRTTYILINLQRHARKPPRRSQKAVDYHNELYMQFPGEG